MRLNYLDILEQCFREKFRGYNKDEVDTFLHLVADDFKDMAEEIQHLKKALAEKNRLIEELHAANKENEKASRDYSRYDPEIMKSKAKQVLNLAREKAEEQQKQAQLKLDGLKNDILKLKKDKDRLIETIKAAAKSQIQQMRAESNPSRASHVPKDNLQ